MTAAPISRLKKTFFYIMMVVLTAAVCYIVLEFVFARFYYSDVYLVNDATYDPVLGWRLKSGSYLTKAPNTFKKHRIYINELGLRNGEITPQAAPGTKRIIILGDSFTYGKMTPTGRIFPVLLEEILSGGDRVSSRAPEDGSTTPSNAQGHAGRRRPAYEVVNAGIPGYGTAQELLFMRDLARNGVTGDIYVVAMFTNDIIDNLNMLYGTLAENEIQPGFAVDSTGALLLVHPPGKHYSKASRTMKLEGDALSRARLLVVLRLRVESFLQTKPRLVRFLTGFGLDVKFPSMPGILNGWYHDEVTGRGIPVVAAVLREIKHETQERGATLLVTLIPSQLQIYPDTYGAIIEQTFPGNRQVAEWLEDPLKPQRITAGICDELGIPFLDLQPVLAKKNYRNLFIPREGHLSERGHRIVAEALAGFILEYDK